LEGNVSVGVEHSPADGDVTGDRSVPPAHGVHGVCHTAAVGVEDDGDDHGAGDDRSPCNCGVHARHEVVVGGGGEMVCHLRVVYRGCDSGSV
jgi:hypothetical protein